MTVKKKPVKQAQKSSGMSAFFTRDAANEGIKFPLYFPNGTRSDDFLIVRGVDSDIFRASSSAAQRDAAVISQIADDEERKAALVESQRKLMATLVAGWSFDEECTIDAVMNFFKQAPQIMDAIDKVVSNRSVLFGISSASSNGLQSNNSD